MSKPAQWQTRAAGSIRTRHESKIRELAEDIIANAGYILADLDRDRVPVLRNLLADAQQISSRVAALEAIKELTEVYESAEG